MKTRVAKVLWLGAALALTGCAASTETSTTMTTASAVPQTAPVDCPMCFTIIEYMRSGPRHDHREKVVVQCERCCERLEFTQDQAGCLYVSTNAHPDRLPCDVCAPAPVR